MNRVRFAPSPTGFLHIGGVRTALYNYLYAKRTGGKFLLRIEDTDLERSEERFTTDILNGLRWLGLTWDEDLVFQSKRMDEYLRISEDWVEKGLAYRCVCTEAEVEKMREAQQKEGKKPKYDGTCREKKIGKDSGKPYAIRAKLPLDGEVVFQDLVRGEIHFQNAELDDFVLVRSSRAPTYNFTVVVDDLEMGITDVIRGEDHINNTPKQLHLYRFLGKEPPRFAHLSMILGPDKKKLSKRNGVVSCNAYRESGILPEALLNFLVRLGWSHGDQEVFTLKEMETFFGFDHVQKSGAVFNPEKLQWLNAEHLKKSEPSVIVRALLSDHCQDWSVIAKGTLQSSLGQEIVGLHLTKNKTLRDMAEWVKPLCEAEIPTVEPSALSWNKDPAKKEMIKKALSDVVPALKARLNGLDRLIAAAITQEAVEAILREIVDRHGIKLGDLAQPLRLAVTGRTASAELFALMTILPWSLVENRIQAAYVW